MRVTKKAKKIIVSRIKFESHYMKWTCPACKVEFHSNALQDNVLRFKCDCGQELIVEKIEG